MISWFFLGNTVSIRQADYIFLVYDVVFIIETPLIYLQKSIKQLRILKDLQIFCGLCRWDQGPMRKEKAILQNLHIRGRNELSVNSGNKNILVWSMETGTYSLNTRMRAKCRNHCDNYRGWECIASRTKGVIMINLSTFCVCPV